MKEKTLLFKDLKKHKNLYQYFKYWLLNQCAEHDRYLPNLVIWFREIFDRAGIDDVPEYLGWDADMAEDFWSWGHNSRWNHTFSVWLECEPEDAMKCAIDLADEHGDPDIEEMYFKNKEDL